MAKLYIISNSHLDPVWIWSRRSGRAAWTNTMHSVVRIMERHPQVKFSCSAASLYRWIEDTDPALFNKIGELVAAGRWEIVGGWEVQSDVILADAESLIRQALVAKEYFRSKFGVEVKTGYCVDSFGHTAGLPKIFKETGFENYVFTRPTVNPNVPYLFDWQGSDGSVITCHRIFESYGSMPAEGHKDGLIARVERNLSVGLEHQTYFFGIGDHGGGLPERQLQWLEELSGKYDICFATLEEYFRAVKDVEKPLFKGEIGPVFRGCYTACHEIKRQVSRGMERMAVAEKCGVPAKELDTAWKELLYNHFHDILPGTCIRDTYVNDVFPGIGSVLHTADAAIDKALFRRTGAMDTTALTQGGVYVWNPSPRPIRAIVSTTDFADPNLTGEIFDSFRDEDGKVLPLQILPPSTTFGPCCMVWGKLTTVVDLPPWGSKVLAYNTGCGPQKTLGTEKQKKLLDKLSFQMFHDDSGTWGFNMEKFLNPVACAEMTEAKVLLDGPVVSVLRSIWKVASSEIRLDLWQYKDVPDIRITMKIDWHEPTALLKLAVAHGKEESHFICGTAADAVDRGENIVPDAFEWLDGKLVKLPANSGEVSFVEWCAACDKDGAAAFYASGLHACDHAEGKLRISLLRTTPYADHHPFPRNVQDGYMDMGTLFRELWYSESEDATPENLPQRARQRIVNVETVDITAHEAGAECSDRIPPYFEVPESVMLETMRLNDRDRWELHLVNYGGDVNITLPGEAGELLLPAHAIRIVEI